MTLNLRERAEACVPSLVGRKSFEEEVKVILAFAQQVQEEEREAIIAMIRDDKGMPRKRQYSALNGWSFIVDDIRARGGQP